MIHTMLRNFQNNTADEPLRRREHDLHIANMTCMMCLFAVEQPPTYVTSGLAAERMRSERECCANHQRMTDVRCNACADFTDNMQR